MLYPFKVYRAVSKDDEKDIFWVAESLSLKGCLSEAKYISDAIERLEEIEIKMLKTAADTGIKLPDVPFVKM